MREQICALLEQLPALEQAARDSFADYAKLNNQHTSRRYRKIDPSFGAAEHTRVSFRQDGIWFEGINSGYEYAACLPWEWLYDRAQVRADLRARLTEEHAEDQAKAQERDAKDRQQYLQLRERFEPGLPALAGRLAELLASAQPDADGDLQLIVDPHEALGLTLKLKELSGDR